MRATVAFCCCAILWLGGCNTVAGLDQLTFEGTGAGGSTSQGWGGCGYMPEPPGDVPCSPPCSCISPTACDVDCRGNLSCNVATINCAEGRSCFVDCASMDDCAGVTVECPEHYPCLVACDGVDACLTATVNCSATGACAVSCEALGACEALTVNCGQNSCDVACSEALGQVVECGDACICTRYGCG